MVIYNGCLTKNLQEKDRLKFLRFGENDKKKANLYRIQACNLSN